MAIKIKLAGVMVGNQDHALKFYTETLGFVTKNDIPLGEFRWLTVVSSEGPDDLELLLEPNAHPAGKTFQAALYADGIPATTLFVTDLAGEYERLRALGVTFRVEPMQAGPVKIAVLDDTCGNYIQLCQT